MGGSGSGSTYHWWRDAKKTTVEECRQLDANRWLREGILKPGVWQSGRWCWFRDASHNDVLATLGYEVNTLPGQGWLRLRYHFPATGEEVAYRVDLATTRPRFGGVRWWFCCPLSRAGRACGRRVGKLYLPRGGRSYGCRRCHCLTYTSCQESRKFDSLHRHIALQMGWSPADVRRALGRAGRRKD